MERQLTEADRLYIFNRATRKIYGAEERWRTRAAQPMTDAELEEALRYELGSEGGGGGPDKPWYWHKAAGLQIGGGWVCRFGGEPLWKGKATIATARTVYGIKTPQEYAEPSLLDFIESTKRRDAHDGAGR